MMELGRCGMPCGLCPMYHIATEGRCTGCSKERGCNVYRCSEDRKVTICAECADSPCDKITSMSEFPNFDTNKVWERNLKEIQKCDINEWSKHYQRKMDLIHIALEKYNAGRSKSFICKTFMMNDLNVLEQIMQQAEMKFTCEDKKESAKQFKKIVTEILEGK